MARDKFLSIMNRTDRQNRDEILGMLHQISYDRGISQEKALALRALPVLIKLSENRQKYEYVEDLYLFAQIQETNKLFNLDELQELERKYIFNEEFTEDEVDRLIKNCKLNTGLSEKLSTEEMISQLIKKLSDELDYTNSKRVRSYMHSYKLGLNWLQSGINSGGVLLSGENILDDVTGKPVIPYVDTKFL